MRLIGVVALAAAMAVVFAIGSGSAVASHGSDVFNKKTCEDHLGTWTPLGGGQKQCVFSETDEGKNTKFECTTEETTSGGPGNLKPHKRHDTETTEEGTVTGSGKCPHGQFKD